MAYRFQTSFDINKMEYLYNVIINIDYRNKKKLEYRSIIKIIFVDK